jgi:hypothetical protein
MKLKPRQPKRMARRSTSLAHTLRSTTRQLWLRQKPSRRKRMPGEKVLLILNARLVETEAPPDQQIGKSRSKSQSKNPAQRPRDLAQDLPLLVLLQREIHLLLRENSTSRDLRRMPGMSSLSTNSMTLAESASMSVGSSTLTISRPLQVLRPSRPMIAASSRSLSRTFLLPSPTEIQVITLHREHYWNHSENITGFFLTLLVFFSTLLVFFK